MEHDFSLTWTINTKCGHLCKPVVARKLLMSSIRFTNRLKKREERTNASAHNWCVHCVPVSSCNWTITINWTPTWSGIPAQGGCTGNWSGIGVILITGVTCLYDFPPQYMIPFLLNQCGSVVYYLTLASVGNTNKHVFEMLFQLYFYG